MTATQAPITQATARIAIQHLVDKFNRDRQRDDYNEQQTREYFILPLFRALGWNTEDPAEFSAEEQISRGRVDFGFYRHGVPVFYLETKRVAERLENPKFIRQAINYAYLRGVTWAVLCDFEQILVYNAQWDSHDLQKVRFLRLNYADYADKDFDDLWLLSKPAFMTNALDRQAEKYGKKAIRRPVTEILFQQLTDWRKQLFTEFRAFGGIFATDTSRVDNAVQRLIDRLIFIRSMEDRGIESRLLQSLVRVAKTEKRNPYIQLQKLFADLDKSYNSNIFATSDLDQLKFTDAVLIEGIIEGLYGNQTSIEYDFNAISADVLGAVYEQYLSFKAQDPHGEQSAKSQKRKSQGIYYTPQFIVRYIIQHTLGVALKNGTDPLKIRVLDPACGSGSFLIEAFDFLDRWIARSHPDMPTSHRRDHILQHNLYGVDLDVQAVEVTRLNLLLRAAYERRLLPPLTHIRHGDSLITPNFDYHTAFDEVFDQGGFDVVVGNPPYVRQETLGADFKDYVAQHYAVYAGTADLYVYFIERGLSLLKDAGQLGYILPNKWMRANYGKALRTFLDDKHIARVVDFGDLPVFPDATTYPSLLFLDNAPKSDTFLATNANTYDMQSDLADFVRDNEYTVARDHLRADGWSLAKSTGQALLSKLMATGTPLGEYVNGKIYRGVLTGYNEAFVIDEATRNRLIAQDPRSAEVIKPFLTGRDIKRYEAPTAEKYVIFLSRSWIRAQMAKLPHPLTPSPLHGEGGQGSEGDNEVFPLPLRSGGRVGDGGASHTEQAGDEGAFGGAHIPRTPTQLWAALKPLARQMRHEPTPAEKHLWGFVRKNQIAGAYFRRQHTIDRFIVDFYCHDARLVIEVDGEIHQYTQEEDAIRQAFLESLGLRVLRFSNDAVLNDTMRVLKVIEDAVNAPHPLTPSPLYREGGQGSDGDNPVFPLPLHSGGRVGDGGAFDGDDAHGNAPHPLTPSPLHGEGGQGSDGDNPIFPLPLRSGGRVGDGGAFDGDDAHGERPHPLTPSPLHGEGGQGSDGDNPVFPLPPFDGGRAGDGGKSGKGEVEWQWLRATYPAVMDYLAQFKDRLMPKPKGHIGEWNGRKSGSYEWYEIQDSIEYYLDFEKPKIIYPDIAIQGKATLDTQKHYLVNTLYMISGLSSDQNHYLLGILNSDIFTKLFSQISSTIRGGYMRWIAQYMEKMPIPTASETDRARLIALVQKQLANHAQLAGLSATESDTRFEVVSAIAKTDAQINALVASLYGIDEADVTALG